MSKQNRRSFIRKSVGTTSALVALGQARFAHSQTEPKASTSPNEQMNVAIIGTGGRDGTHISEMLHADGVTISHICDVDEEKGSQRATQIEKAQGSRPEFKTDLSHILDVPSVDFVTIATPNHWHAMGGIWAIQAGKDAYVEKPVCHNIAEGTALMAALQSRLDTSSAAFLANRERMLALVERLRALEARTRTKSEEAKPLFEKRGQLLPRERIARLLDLGAP